MHNFKELKVWQKAIDFVVEIYQLTESFPDREKFGIISQIQRAAVSITCTISEGSGKSSNKDFNRFLEMALGSANEVENLLIISYKLNYLNKEQSVQLINKVQEIRKMLFGLKKTL